MAWRGDDNAKKLPLFVFHLLGVSAPPASFHRTHSRRVPTHPRITRQDRNSKKSWSRLPPQPTDSTAAKKASVGFVDSIFAEDIGKFPDTNLAESFNRIPGITITRETSGEGLNIAIRGLGTNFTRVLLNDAPVAIASTGRTDARTPIAKSISTCSRRNCSRS
jgi:outer membrane receptor for ferrienterochelin and colicin